MLASRFAVHHRLAGKLLAGLAMLLAILATLAWCGFQGWYDYRGLLEDLARVGELSTATELNQKTSDLRVAGLSLPRDVSEMTAGEGSLSARTSIVKAEFRHRLQAFEDALDEYRRQLADHRAHTPIGISVGERRTLGEIDDRLAHIWELEKKVPQSGPADLEVLNDELQSLQGRVDTLPSFLHDSINQLPDAVRGQYRRRIAVLWGASAATILLLLVFMGASYTWVFRPLRLLVKGARKFASGNYGYRIALPTQDEMAELASAMNATAASFQAIRDDLEGQVQQRTREVVRTQQLASVGYLAAGVAQEINTPLASISACAETLERQAAGPAGGQPRRQAMLADLARIQEEAFRCGEITGSLLAFSRTGDARPAPADLRDLAQDMVDMIGLLPAYHGKRLRMDPREEAVFAPVSPQEFKQVLLNLATLALDNVDAGGTVTVSLRRRAAHVQLVVADDGPALSHSEQREVFDPCYTRRRGALGLGFGLSIAQRIVHDHAGQIEVTSGIVSGNLFRVTLPAADGPSAPEVRLGSFTAVGREAGGSVSLGTDGEHDREHKAA